MPITVNTDSNLNYYSNGSYNGTAFKDSNGKLYILFRDPVNYYMKFAISSDNGLTWNLTTSGSAGLADSDSEGYFVKYGTKIYQAYLHRLGDTHEVRIRYFCMSDDASAYTWSSATTIYDSSYQLSDDCLMTIMSTGKKIVVFGEYDQASGRYRIMFTYYNGSSWSTPTRLDISAYDNTSQHLYDIVLGASDKTYVTYYVAAYYSGYTGVVVQSISSSGVKDSPIQDGVLTSSNYKTKLFYYTHDSAERIVVVGYYTQAGTIRVGCIDGGASSITWDSEETLSNFSYSSGVAVGFNSSTEYLVICCTHYGDSKFYRHISLLLSRSWSIVKLYDYAATCLAVAMMSSTKYIIFFTYGSEYAFIEADPDIFVTPTGRTFKFAIVAPTVLFTNLEGFPIDDTALNGWTDKNGNTVDIYESINEDVIDNTDYIQSPVNANHEIYKTKLCDMTAGGTSYITKFYFSYRKNNNAHSCNLKVRLLQNTTTIKELTYTGITTTWTTVEYELTAGEIASITDWTDLYVELEAYQ